MPLDFTLARAYSIRPWRKLPPAESAASPQLDKLRLKEPLIPADYVPLGFELHMSVDAMAEIDEIRTLFNLERGRMARDGMRAIVKALQENRSTGRAVALSYEDGKFLISPIGQAQPQSAKKQGRWKRLLMFWRR